MNGSLNIFGSKRLNRPNADGVNPALAEVTRLEMFGVDLPPDITGASAITATAATSSSTGSLVFTGPSAVTATAATGAASSYLIFAGSSASEAAPATVSGSGELLFSGSASPAAEPATTTASGLVSGDFVPEPPVQEGGGGVWLYQRPRQRPRHEGEARLTATAAQSSARGLVLIRIGGTAEAIARPPRGRGVARLRFSGRGSGISQPVRVVAAGQVRHRFTGRSRLVQRPARSLCDGYATRGRSERDLLTALFF